MNDLNVLNEELKNNEEPLLKDHYPTVKQAIGLVAIGLLILIFMTVIGYSVVKGNIHEQLKQANNIDYSDMTDVSDILASMRLKNEAGTLAMFYMVVVMFIGGLVSYGAELFYGLSMKGLKLRDAFRNTNKRDWKTFGFVLFGLLMVSFLTSKIIKATASGTLLEGRDLFLSTFNKTQSDIITWIILPGFILAVIIAPIFEELIYRRVILDGFLKQFSPQQAILYSTLIFTVIHFNIKQMIPVFIMGLLLGYLYYKTRSVLMCIVGHMIYNLMGLLFFTQLLMEIF